MKRRARSRTSDRRYDPEALVDAPEHYDYARALGTLTWGTWDHGTRPVEERIRDFVNTFPPEGPLRHSPGGSLLVQPDGTFKQGTLESRTARFLAEDGRPGSIHELLSRYGLRAATGPTVSRGVYVPRPVAETTRRRNMKLRVLHGRADVEAHNMNAAKAAFMDQLESKEAAEQTRAARKKMLDELAGRGPEGST